jgi:hypothetical protein
LALSDRRRSSLAVRIGWWAGPWSPCDGAAAGQEGRSGKRGRRTAACAPARDGRRANPPRSSG